MKTQLAKLINVKSIVTLGLTSVFAVLSLRENISAEQFQTVFTTIMLHILLLISLNKED